MRFGRDDPKDDANDERCIVEIEVWNKLLGTYVLVPEELAQQEVAVEPVEVEGEGGRGGGGERRRAREGG